MKYINNIKDYENFISFIKNKKIIILPTFVDHQVHYAMNKPSFLYIKEMITSEEFVMGIGHPDLFTIPIEKLKDIEPQEIWTINQKSLLNIVKNKKIIDVSMLTYLLDNDLPDWTYGTPITFYYQRKFSLRQDVNNIIPVTKHLEIHQINSQKISEIFGNFNSFESLTNYGFTLTTIHKLESIGIKVNPTILKFYYSDSISPYISANNFVYSEYNFYTSTGRPSNRYGNINFAALDKSNGVRRSFIPRNDNFFLFDFRAFHLKLISKFINYSFETDDIHGYLGKYYYGKEKLTSEEYDEAKKLNFKYLYGGIPEIVRDTIPYFAKVQDFTFKIWRSMKKNGYYESPLTKRKMKLKHIKNPTPTKVFNYFIQLMETETNMVIIEKLQDYLENFKTKLILYTYDSFLFDYSKEDRKECILGIKKILEVFPTKIYFGKNYQDLIEVTGRI